MSIAAILLVQFGLLSGFNSTIASIVVPVALLPLFTYGRGLERYGVLTPIFLGVVWDSMSPYLFGAYTVAFLVTTLGSSWFFETVVTNTSLASYVVLSAIAIAIFYLVFFAVVVIGGDIADGATLSYYVTLALPCAFLSLLIAMASYGVARFIGTRPHKGHIPF